MSDRGESNGQRLSRSHWGVFEPIVIDGQLAAIKPFANDSDPSPILASIPDSVNHGSRVMRPAVRESWLKHGPGSAGRGSDRYVEVSWARALGFGRGRTKAGDRGAWQRIHLCRLLWMVECRPLPSRTVATKMISSLAHRMMLRPLGSHDQRVISDKRVDVIRHRVVRGI
jgi:Molybdopterin oxidoreductase N-terminal domain